MVAPVILAALISAGASLIPKLFGSGQPSGEIPLNPVSTPERQQSQQFGIQGIQDLLRLIQGMPFNVSGGQQANPYMNMGSIYTGQGYTPMGTGGTLMDMLRGGGGGGSPMPTRGVGGNPINMPPRGQINKRQLANPYA